jgi:putative hydrolase of the HAD superfamily
VETSRWAPTASRRGTAAGDGGRGRPYARGVASKVRAVLFDFDGTLAYYSPRHLELYVRAAAEHGVVVTLEALAAAVVESAWGPWETPQGVEHRRESRNERAYSKLRAKLHRSRYEAAGATGAPADLDAACVQLVELESDASNVALYDDTLPALERLREAGVVSYVVSNHVWRLGQMIAELGLTPYINATISSARVGVRKPHPAIFEAAIAASDAAREEMVFVGDSLSADVVGARGVGMRAVLLDRTGASKEPGAIRSLMEVPLCALGD